MNRFQHINHIIDGIHVGSEYAARDLALLKRRKITAILSLQAEASYRDLYPDDFLYLRLPLHDGEIIDGSVFDEALAFIERALAEGRKILVHCAMGVSRSPSIVAAYLMAVKGMDPLEALEFLREKRPIVAPAVECFMSAVEHAYPDVTWRCEKCGGKWQYWSLWWSAADTVTCSCQNPKLRPEKRDDHSVE